ncbi:hypothetical protein RRG08_009457 [Elysia crispata]|uniref:Uncharacterized protein n=1 Tax=Elysia crispata TaxID=231223 RepID=A0AAE0YWJ9_9GAST|nr:hypothetical protein RRG08_009457 [Elysia crispata]
MIGRNDYSANIAAEIEVTIPPLISLSSPPKTWKENRTGWPQLSFCPNQECMQLSGITHSISACSPALQMRQIG